MLIAPQVLSTFTVVLLVHGANGVRDQRARPTQHQPVPAVVQQRATATETAAGLSTNICGWQQGDPGKPWNCAVSGQCLIEPTLSVIGCCPGTVCGIFRTACIPQSQTCDASCMNNQANLVCVGSNSLCATYQYTNSVSEMRCVSTVVPPDQLQIAHTFTGFQTPILLPRIIEDVTSLTFHSVSIMTQMPSTTTSPSGTDSGTSSADRASSTATPPSNQGSSVSVAAIAGGVGGGVAVLAFVVGGLFWWSRRHSKKLKREGESALNSQHGGGIPAYHPVGYSVASKDDYQMYQQHMAAQQPTYVEADEINLAGSRGYSRQIRPGAVAAELQ